MLPFSHRLAGICVLSAFAILGLVIGGCIGSWIGAYLIVAILAKGPGSPIETEALIFAHVPDDAIGTSNHMIASLLVVVPTIVGGAYFASRLYRLAVVLVVKRLKWMTTEDVESFDKEQGKWG